MTRSPIPSDPDPAQSPDLDSEGSAPAGRSPDSHSTSMLSDSASQKQGPMQQQSPPPRAGFAGVYVWLAVIGVLILLVAVGLIGYAVTAA